MDTKIYTNDFKELPNFLEFIEADMEKVFGSKGVFIVIDIFNLTMINGAYGSDIGDSCIKGVCHSINNVVKAHQGTHGFRFGNNDFIITLPGGGNIEAERIYSEVEEEFKNMVEDLVFSGVKLNKFTLEYSEEIHCVEDFYELLFNNVSVLGETKEASRRIIRHIIGTFTTNIRKTVTSYINANNLALRDDISGLSNHRAAKLFLSNTIEEYSKNKKGFAVMFIDGDNLKRYNKISYEAGNQMIRNLSQIITNSIRNEDKVFRWLSGDEFLVVLKGISEEFSLKLAERVRESVEKQTEHCIYPTTISIGIAHYPCDGGTIEEVISKSEIANSWAKNIGRNKVVRWNSAIGINEEAF